MPKLKQMALNTYIGRNGFECLIEEGDSEHLN